VRYLGVDPGGKKIGLAVGDDGTGIASPLEVVGFDGSRAEGARIIVSAAARIEADRIVVGVPSLADGTMGPAARRAELLAEALQHLGYEVALQAEYLTTNEARRRAHSAGRQRKQPVDDIAAQIILEEFLAGLETQPGLEE
jgi:putative Holliday junction resolvase